MNLKELDSFKLSDAVTFHDHLNPALWTGHRLKPAVKDQLILIAKDFLEELGVDDLDVKDITVSGSNAAYSYTNHSDLDLHILVDTNGLNNDEVYKELFNAKKTLYNDSHDITVNNVPVELYVQDANEPVVSLGEYSILHNEWLRLPTKRRANFDHTATQAKYEKLLKVVEVALLSKDLHKVEKVLKTIKRYRQAGLDKGGEFGPENLAFKALRSQGYITKLYVLRDKLHSKFLSFETMYQDPVKVQELPVAKEDTMQYASEKTSDINPYGGQRDRQYRGSISEASGYIPSEKEKNDPRFKTALTVDIKPDSIKKNAKAFSWLTSRAGIPPQARTNGKI
jgi:hypothetical protein